MGKSLSHTSPEEVKIWFSNCRLPVAFSTARLPEGNEVVFVGLLINRQQLPVIMLLSLWIKSVRLSEQAQKTDADNPNSK